MSIFQYSICAFLAPALAAGAAFPWAIPEPTFVIPAADNWSPAPTPPPGFGAMDLFKRAAEGNTCGYISGEEASSLTCVNTDYICATNTFYGVHGCCDPNNISSCSLATTCVPSSLMSASCTDDACSTNDYIAKCTATDEPSCYEWRYVYSDRTVMTEYGCASEGFTITVERTATDGTTTTALSDVALSSLTSSAEESSTTADSTVESTTEASTTTDSSTVNNAQSATGTPTAASTTAKKSNTGAIVGGVVAGLAILGAIAIGVIFLILRNRKAKQNAANAATGVNQPFMGPAPGVTEYKPQAGGYASPGQGYPPTPGQGYAPPPGQGYAPVQPYGSPQPGYAVPAAAGYYGNENKAWQQQGVAGQELGPHQQPYSPPVSPAPQYSGPSAVQPVPFGTVEAAGTPIHNPAQAPQHPGHGPVYEAP